MQQVGSLLSIISYLVDDSMFISYSAGITKATTRQPTFCADSDVLLEILEQNRLKHVISPFLVIFDFLEQIVLEKKEKKSHVHVLHFENHQINALPI
jgi:hypothetical protein